MAKHTKDRGGLLQNLFWVQWIKEKVLEYKTILMKQKIMFYWQIMGKKSLRGVNADY